MRGRAGESVSAVMFTFENQHSGTPSLFFFAPAALIKMDFLYGNHYKHLYFQKNRACGAQEVNSSVNIIGGNDIQQVQFSIRKTN